MEVKINREIRDYTESMFFGLSLRQFVFSLTAVLVALGIYFLLKPHFGTETVSWMCIVGAAPFAALGFIRYNGMTAERLIWAWLRSEFIIPKKLTFRATNFYYEALKSERGPRAACRVGRGGATERVSFRARAEASDTQSATTKGGKQK